MSETCGARHPDDPGRTCIAKGRTHGDHVDAQGIWPNPERIELVQSVIGARRTQKRSRGIHTKAARARQGKRELRAEDVGQGGYPAYTKITGMETAATSRSSEEFRDLFTRAMRQVAETQPEFSTNDVWDLLLSLGYEKIGSHQAAGTIGNTGISQGWWEDTGRTTKNTAPWAHSKDLDVKVYRSKIYSPRPSWGSP